jgi:two-component system NtrC family sensor kinase
MKILVVEDDLVTGTLLNKILTKQGYEVSHITDGAKALEALQTGSYRIILTDWMMPEMDGPTLCRHIRGLNLPHYIYIILLTAKSSKDDAVAGLESGADDYIVKPFDKLELLARIRAGRRLVDLEDINRNTLQKLSHTEKLAAVGHLAAGVAHEINNPIGFINSNLNSLTSYIHDIKQMLACYRELAQTLDQSICEKQLHAKLPKLLKQSVQMEQEYDLDFVMQDAGELVGDCLSGAERIKTIVHEMRYFAHPEKQSIEPFNLAVILNKVVSQFTARLPPGVAIDNTVGDLPEIECNGPHIEQAFTKLVQNAIDAVDGNGQIVIEGRIAGDGLEIEIRDNGRGIAPAHLSKVFDPFFTTKDVGQGVGLGLTTALNIIRMHNGSIHAESKPGEATSFKVSLPLAATAR